MKIDLKSNTRKVRERLRGELDPIVRRNLETVIRHTECELACDLEGTLATIAPNPVYHLFFGDLTGQARPANAGKTRADHVWLSGAAAVRDLYSQSIPARLHWSQFDVDYVVADRERVVIDGLMHAPYPGAMLISMGRKVDDPEALYLGIGRFVASFPFDPATGLLLGEDIVVDPTFLDGIEQRKVSADDFLPSYGLDGHPVDALDDGKTCPGEIIGRFNQALSVGDTASALALIHEDVDWWTLGAGKLTKADLAKAYAGIFTKVADIDMRIASQIVEGDIVSLDMICSYRLRSGEELADNAMHLTARVAGGQIAAMREYMDMGMIAPLLNGVLPTASS